MIDCLLSHLQLIEWNKHLIELDRIASTTDRKSHAYNKLIEWNKQARKTSDGLKALLIENFKRSTDWILSTTDPWKSHQQENEYNKKEMKCTDS